MKKKMFMKKVGRPPKSDKEKLIEELYEEEPMSQVSMVLTAKLHAKLKIYAANRRMSIKNVLIEKIEEMTVDNKPEDK